LFELAVGQFLRWNVRGWRGGLEFVNSIVAIALAVFLIIIAIKADDRIAQCREWFALVSIGMSFLPALCTLAALWFDARRRIRTLLSDAKWIESQALQTTG